MKKYIEMSIEILLLQASEVDTVSASGFWGDEGEFGETNELTQNGNFVNNG